MTTLSIDLPDTLAREAKAAGLLKPETIQQMLREAMRKKAVNELFTAADRLATAKLPPMTPGEIQDEVNAVRAQRPSRAPGA